MRTLLNVTCRDGPTVMCNGHQILSPVDKATVLPIIGNSLRVGCLYCAEGTKQGARCTCLCCGNCLVCPNTGKGVAFLPQFSASEVKFSLIKEIVINPKSLSPLKVFSIVGAAAVSERSVGGKIIGFASSDL